MAWYDRFIGIGADTATRPPAGQDPHLGVQAFSSFDLSNADLPCFLREGITASGRTVTERSATSNATFYRAINLISSSIGMLPLQIYERKANGDRDKARDHPVYKLLHRRPNDYQTPLEFKAYMQGRALLKGNGYALKVKGASGRIISLVPMDPAQVEAKLGDDYRMAYKWTRPDGRAISLKADEVFHLRAPFSSNGVTGDALLKVAAEALGLAGATDEAAARLMRNGAYVGGVLEHPKQLSPKTIETLASNSKIATSGRKTRGSGLSQKRA